MADSPEQEFQADHRVVVETLSWNRPGAVWAIDHSQPPRPVDGCYDKILAIRDLTSGMQLAWAVEMAGLFEHSFLEAASS